MALRGVFMGQETILTPFQAMFMGQGDSLMGHPVQFMAPGVSLMDLKGGASMGPEVNLMGPK